MPYTATPTSGYVPSTTGYIGLPSSPSGVNQIFPFSRPSPPSNYNPSPPPQSGASSYAPRPSPTRLEDLAASSPGTPKGGGANPTRLGGIKLPPYLDDVVKSAGGVIDDIGKAAGALKVLRKLVPILEIIGLGADGVKTGWDLGQKLAGLTGAISDLIEDTVGFDSDPTNWSLSPEEMRELMGDSGKSLLENALQDGAENRGGKEEHRGEDGTLPFTPSPSLDIDPEIITPIPPSAPTAPQLGPSFVGFGYVFAWGPKRSYLVGLAGDIDYVVVIRGPYWGSDKAVRMRVLGGYGVGDGNGGEWVRTEKGGYKLIPDEPRTVSKEWIYDQLRRPGHRIRSMEVFKQKMIEAREILRGPTSASAGLFASRITRYVLQILNLETGEKHLVHGDRTDLRFAGIPIPPVVNGTLIITDPPMLVARPPAQTPVHSPRQKKEKEKKKMDCCPTVLDNNRMLKMISAAVAAPKFVKGVELPSSAFLDSSDPDLSMLIGGIPRMVRSIPDMIWYFVEQLDAFYGDWPFTLQIPDHIVEAARQSGEAVPSEIKVFNMQDAFEECLKFAFNLQDDEAIIKELGKRAILEAHLARQEAAEAKANLRALIEWTGMGYKEKMRILKANFTIPGIADQIANVVPGMEGALSIDAWDKQFGDDRDKELEKFLETSHIPIKTLEIDRTKDDLMVTLLAVRQAIAIIKHAHTASVGYKDIEKNVESFVRDFDKKARYGAEPTKEEFRKKGKYTAEDEDNLEIEDPERLKDLKKWAEYAEDGYVGEDASNRYETETGMVVTTKTGGGDPEPFGRTQNERPKIQIRKNTHKPDSAK